MIVQLTSVEDLKVLSGKTFKEIEEVEAIDIKNVRKVDPFDFQMTEKQRINHVKNCMEILLDPKTWDMETYAIKKIGETEETKKSKRRKRRNRKNK